MKKALLVGVLGLFLSPLVTEAALNTNLKYGMTSTGVSELQDFLVDKGFLNTNPTGYFGVLTLKAVKAYQLSMNLPSTGYVGVLTRGAINTELASITAESDVAEQAEIGSVTPVPVVPTPVQDVQPAPVLGNQAPVVTAYDFTPIVQTGCIDSTLDSGYMHITMPADISEASVVLSYRQYKVERKLKTGRNDIDFGEAGQVITWTIKANGVTKTGQVTAAATNYSCATN